MGGARDSIADLRDAAQATAAGPHVYRAIAAVMASLSRDGITKDRRNKQGEGYNFRGVDDVYNALSGLLSEHGLCIIPRVLSREAVERTSSKGNKLIYTAVDVEFDLVSSVDGSKHTARTAGEAMDSGDKSTNKAMSAAYKYMAFQTFCIPTEADNDSENDTYELGADRRAPPRDKAAEDADLVDRATRAIIDMRDDRDITNWVADFNGPLKTLSSDDDFAAIMTKFKARKAAIKQPQREMENA